MDAGSARRVTRAGTGAHAHATDGHAQAAALGTWRHVLKKAFFVEQPDSEVDSCEDHLAVVASDDPEGAARFIKSMTKLSACFTVALGVLVAVYLSLSWTRCASCNRPLRWWILIQVLLQLLQLPVRLVLFFSVRAAETAGGSIRACVVSIIAAPAWSVTKTVAVAHYGWLLLGIVWLTHWEPRSRCPDMGHFVLMVVVLCALRSFAATLIFRAHFLPNVRPGQPPEVVGASKEQIASLALVRVSGAHCQEAACSICLVDFGEGQLVKRLPCKHDFHGKCIDVWLQRSNKCPLCVQPIDEPLLAGFGTGTCGIRSQGQGVAPVNRYPVHRH